MRTPLDSIFFFSTDARRVFDYKHQQRRLYTLFNGNAVCHTFERRNVGANRSKIGLTSVGELLSVWVSEVMYNSPPQLESDFNDSAFGLLGESDFNDSARLGMMLTR